MNKLALPLFLLASSASAAQLCPAARSLGNGTGGLIETSTKQILYYGGFTRSFDLTRIEPQLKRLNEAFQRRGIKLVVLPIPHSPSVYGDEIDYSDPALAEFPIAKGFSAKEVQRNFKTMIDQMASYGLTPLNLLPTILAFKPSATGERFYYSNDSHWTSSGADAAAQFVTSEINRLFPDLVESFPTNPIDLVPSGTFPNYGFSPMIKQACGVDWPIPQGQLLKVIPKGTTEVGLLDDQTIPIVLFGDSFSAVNRNFDFFLHKYFATDVLNFGVSGGAFFDSMTSYFINLQPGDDLAKIAIWQYLNTLPAAEPFRQLIPAVYGECTVAASLASSSVKEIATETPVLNIPASANVTGHQYFAYFKANDLGLVKFDVRVEYQDGQVETIPVTRSPRVKNNGRYFVELNDAIKGAVTRISLIAPTGTKGSVQGKVCAEKS